jgi:hypothetical protein
MPYQRCFILVAYSGRHVIVALLLAGYAVAVEAGSYLFDVRAAWQYDDNLNAAEASAQQVSDNILSLTANAGYRTVVSEHSGVTVKLGLETDIHADIDDLNAVNPQARIDYLLQPRRGFTAPWYAISLGVTGHRHSNSDLRDGYSWTLEASTGKRLTDRIAVRAGYRYRDRTAEQGDVWDLNQHQLMGRVDYRITDGLGLFADYTFLTGDVVSVSRNPKFPPVATALAPDPVFGLNAWRLDGDTHTLTLGGRYAFSRHTGLDARFSYAKTDADGGNEWNDSTAELALSHRF